MLSNLVRLCIGDGRVLVFFEAVHLVAVQGTHVVRLPALLLLLLRFLTLLAFGDCGFRAPPDIRGERMPLVLLCGDRFGLVPVFRLAAELPSRTLLFDGGLAILCAPLGFFSDGLPAGVPRVSFPLVGGFRRSAVPPPSLTRPFSVCRPSSVRSCGAPRVSRVPLRVPRVGAELGLSVCGVLVIRGVSLLIVIGHVALLRRCRHASACAGGHARNGARAGRAGHVLIIVLPRPWRALRSCASDFSRRHFEIGLNSGVPGFRPSGHIRLRLTEPSSRPMRVTVPHAIGTAFGRLCFRNFGA